MNEPSRKYTPPLREKGAWRGRLWLWSERLWRIVMTGLCFLLFGLGGLALALIWFNLLLLMVRDRQRRRKIARASISASFRLFFWWARFVRVLDYQMTDVDVLRGDRCCLLVANHPTLLDYVFLASVLPQIDCVVKSRLLKNPFVGGVIKAADYLVNDEQAQALMQACQARFDAGATILIFPEGTRTRAAQAVKLQRGAANIAIRCAVNIRLVKICCRPPVVTKESKWYQAPLSKPVFTISAQELIEVERFMRSDAGHKFFYSLAARNLNAYLTTVLMDYKFCTFGKSI